MDETDNKIRVLHIIGNLQFGGAQNCLKQLIENNTNSSIVQYIHSLRSQRNETRIDGNLIPQPYSNYDIRKFFALLKILKKYQIDIIHAHLHKPIMGALLATFFCDAKVIVHEHGSIARPGIQYTFYRLMLRLLKRRADLVIAVSEAVSGQLCANAGIDAVQIRVVYNAVDLNKFTPHEEQRQRLRDDLGVGPSDVIIGFVGRLTHVKGPDILLHAFERLIRNNPNCILAYLGDGDMKPLLQNKAVSLGIDQKVKFLGFHENAAEVMNLFDVAAITSRQDAFPLTPLELMSMKIPLVSCNVYGLAEVVKNEQNALVPDKNEPPEIAHCIERLVHDKSLRERLAKNASETVRQFDIPRMISQINTIYRSVLNRTSQGHPPD